MKFDKSKSNQLVFFKSQSNIISVPGLEESMSGAQMLPNPSGNGAILSHHAEIFELTCNQYGCSWKEKRHKLLQEKENHVMMYVPDDLCH